LKEVSEGDKEFEQELIDLYKETCEEKLPLLETALKKLDSENSILYSHDIKGSSANIGANVVRQISEKMELFSRKGEYKEAHKLYPELKEELQKTYEVLAKYIEEED